VATLLNDVKNRFASVDLALLSFRQSTQERKKKQKLMLMIYQLIIFLFTQLF